MLSQRNAGADPGTGGQGAPIDQKLGAVHGCKKQSTSDTDFDVKIRFRPTICCNVDAYFSFGAHCTNLNEDRPILSSTKM